MLTDLIVKCYGDTHDLPNLSDYKSRHCYMLVFSVKVRPSDMLSSYTQKNKYLKLSMTSLFTLQSDYEKFAPNSLTFNTGFNEEPFHLFPKYFWILRL
jgi:hypothetical protein